MSDSTMKSRKVFLSRKAGKEKVLKKASKRKKPCSVEGCNTPVRVKGLCQRHGGKVVCRTPGCNLSSARKGFCIGHCNEKFGLRFYADVISRIQTLPDCVAIAKHQEVMNFLKKIDDEICEGLDDETDTNSNSSIKGTINAVVEIEKTSDSSFSSPDNDDMALFYYCNIKPPINTNAPPMSKSSMIYRYAYRRWAAHQLLFINETMPYSGGKGQPSDVLVRHARLHCKWRQFKETLLEFFGIQMSDELIDLQKAALSVKDDEDELNNIIDSIVSN